MFLRNTMQLSGPGGVAQPRDVDTLHPHLRLGHCIRGAYALLRFVAPILPAEARVTMSFPHGDTAAPAFEGARSSGATAPAGA